ncbi:MT-A70 family methyltransferase [Methylobacterium sp. E-045]|uniref:MT-A70 family methyltransferase n=1 Tax=Methylobacterium sp. E-045 TaxID=2836575 RepID=UPI001FB97986|nr:MT-A70 family methyltransferase [Methylobacterium sp. E-045]MCJ2129203.1 MT-A70 family methyltransferase [Methylobacterium sp. E-045]
MTWPFGTLPPFGFDMLMVDPPWSFALRSDKGEAKSAQAQYDCMTLDAIKALPVAELARGDAFLWLWATNPMLPQALAVMAAWGFTFTTSGTWVKTTSGGKIAFGTGYVLRCASEPFLIGKFGHPRAGRSVRSVIMAPIREHSRKPDEAYDAAEALMPSAIRRADLFSRESRPGWTAWGNEAGHFDAPALMAAE